MISYFKLMRNGQKNKFFSLSSLLNTHGGTANSRSVGKRRKEQLVFDFLEIIKNWHLIIGNKNAQHSAPIRIVNGTLFVACNHSAIAHILSLSESIILKKLSATIPDSYSHVKKLSFKFDQKIFRNQKKIHEKNNITENKPKKQELHPLSPKVKELKKEAEKIYSEISDPEMRQSLINLYIQSSV